MLCPLPFPASQDGSQGLGCGCGLHTLAACEWCVLEWTGQRVRDGVSLRNGPGIWGSRSRDLSVKTALPVPLELLVTQALLVLLVHLERAVTEEKLCISTGASDVCSLLDFLVSVCGHFPEDLHFICFQWNFPLMRSLHFLDLADV